MKVTKKQIKEKAIKVAKETGKIIAKTAGAAAIGAVAGIIATEIVGSKKGKKGIDVIIIDNRRPEEDNDIEQEITNEQQQEE